MSDQNQSEANENLTRRRLVSWPLSLVALTAALLLLTQVAAGFGRMRGGEFDLEEAKERVEHVLDHVLDDLDVTDDQEARIQTIVFEGIDELAAAHPSKDEAHSELGDLLTAEVIDRDAIEAMRQEHMARADVMTAIATRRISEALEVLTPEQRRELHAEFEKRHRRHRRWH